MVLNFQRSINLLQERGMLTQTNAELVRAYEIDQSIIATAYKLGLVRKPD